MNKSNFMTLFLLCAMAAAAVLFSKYTDSITEAANTSSDHDLSAAAASSYDFRIPTAQEALEAKKAAQTASDVASQEENPSGEASLVDPVSAPDDENTLTPADMSDALFIGDSRTVGIMEYSGIKSADYFCSSGLNVFQVRKERITVPNIGKVTLEELLSNKKYGKIYIMLGINELGYRLQSILDKYNELLLFIEGNQPDAVIFIQANLHVSKIRSDKDQLINNPAIDRLNKELSKLADQKTRFYLDANFLFDDPDGSLSSTKTQDNAHLYAKYYLQWGDWICTETGKYVKE